MKRILWFLFALVLIACGGGPIGETRVAGRVLDISTGAPTTVASTVQSSAGTGNTSVVDGSFLIFGAKNETSLIVNAPSALSYPSFTYTFAPLTQNVNDVGDLWVGPEKVQVTGTVQNASNNAGVPGASVTFAGQRAITDASGNFTVTQVAYSSANTSSFLGLIGRVEATGFLANEFSTGGNTATGGVVNIGTILVSPIDSSDPPPLPYNIWGLITPSASAPGTIVKLKLGGTEVRRFTVGVNARYQFWVPAGSYTLEFSNGTLTSPTQNANLANSSDVIRADANLS